MKRLFITGTDSEVGKTVISRALLQKLAEGNKRTVGYKPVATGCQQTEGGLCNKDALLLQASSSIAVSYAAINPVLLPGDDISMCYATSVDYARLSQGLLSLYELADHVVVDGTGGWHSLINGLRPFSAWVADEKLPVVMVVGIKPGCISHALLTAQAIANDGLPLRGWITNRINPGLAHYAEIIDILRHKIAAPLLGELPYLPRAETRDLTQYLDLSAVM